MNYEQLVKALRCCATDNCGSCPYGIQYEFNCATKMVNDAAAAIEDLQAQLPKRGKWVGVSPTVDTVQCSVCGGQLFSAELETPYCPYCGAKMDGERREG